MGILLLVFVSTHCLTLSSPSFGVARNNIHQLLSSVSSARILESTIDHNKKLSCWGWRERVQHRKHPTRGAHQSRRHAKRSGIRIAKVRVRVIRRRRRRKGKPNLEGWLLACSGTSCFGALRKRRHVAVLEKKQNMCCCWKESKTRIQVSRWSLENQTHVRSTESGKWKG